MKIPHQFNQHHTTYCQEEPFVETRKLFFARADFRDVDLRGACSVWNILRIGGYWIHLQVFEGRAHEAKDPWLQANQAIQDTRIIATFITFWLCRPPLLVEPAPSLGMSEGLMSIPPSTDPTPSDPARTKNLLKTKNQNPSRTRPGLCFLGYRCGRWMEVTGFSKVSKVPKSNLFLQNSWNFCQFVSLSCGQRLAALTPKLWGGDRPLSLWIWDVGLENSAVNATGTVSTQVSLGDSADELIIAPSKLLPAIQREFVLSNIHEYT